MWRNKYSYLRTPTGLEDTSKYPKLIEYLLSQGNWTHDDIVKLIGGNILRALEQNEQVNPHFLYQKQFYY